MAAGEINMKQILEDIKSFCTKEMDNAKKITEKIIEKMDTKFDELSTRIETIDRKEEVVETLAKQNQNNSNLTSESTAQEKLVEQAKKMCELEENIEDQVNRNSRDMLVIRVIKKENQEKTWNNTSHVLSSSLCGSSSDKALKRFSDEEKSSWKSYVKYPGVLMVKIPEHRNYSLYMVATD